MSDDIPTKEDFIRNSIDLDRSKGWKLISASTIMKNEFKYSGEKFEIVQSYLHAIDILSNPLYLRESNALLNAFLYWSRYYYSAVSGICQ